MQEKVEYEKTLTISDVVEIIKNRFIWIVLIILVCVASGYAYTSLVQKTSYTATSSLCVQAKNYVYIDADGKEVTSNLSEHTKYQYSALIAPEYENVLKSPEIINALIAEGVKINPASLSFKFGESSAFFSVSYTYSVHGGDTEVIKAQVANLLNEYIKKSIEVIDDENSIYPEYLKDKLINVSVASSNAVSVDTGVTKIILVSILIGVILSALLIITLYFADNTIKNREDVDSITGLSNLAVIDLFIGQGAQEKKVELVGDNGEVGATSQIEDSQKGGN